MKIKAIISSIIVCIIILLGGQVNAAMEASVIGEAPEVAKPGEKIEYKLKVKADTVGKGIDGIVANMEYSKEVLELAATTSDEVIIMEGMLLVALDEPIKAGEEKNITLNFTIDSNTTKEEATIKFTDIILTDVDQTSKEDIENIETKIQIQENIETGEQQTKKELSNIEITTAPSKTTYTEGEKFDKAGMKIIAKYSDGTSKEITDYKYSPEGELKTTDTKITISYTENETTKTIEQEIKVTKKTGETNKENNKDNSTAGKEYPKTGAETIIVPICIVIIITLVSYKKYKKYKKI